MKSLQRKFCAAESDALFPFRCSITLKPQSVRRPRKICEKAEKL
jgi:hypothetical protein